MEDYRQSFGSKDWGHVNTYQIVLASFQEYLGRRRRRKWQSAREPCNRVCSPPLLLLLLLLLWDFAGLRGRGAGRWRHRYAKYADSPSKQEPKVGVFQFFHPGTIFFRKRASTGFIWTIGQTMQNVRYRHVLNSSNSAAWSDIFGFKLYRSTSSSSIRQSCED